MSYPKIKINDMEFILNPELIQEVARQLPAQIKAMSLTEMMEAARALKAAGESTGITRLVGMIGKSFSGRT
ncbi:hypothetical protein LCGC14_0632190 [marine sediment metagenome]|uniref:Uncharacterized protein n=1 Tax=marine sediment metagenome TaxID=412755 RepID=A0A0F9R6W0_9ZZZZ